MNTHAQKDLGKLSLQDAPKARIAIVGGTHINDAALKRKGLLTQQFMIDTKMGESPAIYFGQHKRIPFYYIHFHGEGRLMPTWVALYDLKVTDVLGGATAGGINPNMDFHDYVIPHDFIDMNVDRPTKFPREIYRNPEQIPIPRYTPAMDPDLRTILIEETRQAVRGDHQYDDINVYDKGVLIQARGGRFETVAEIKMFAQWGADLVTLNVGTEMAYARMLGINFASLNVISNPAEGVAEWEFAQMPPLYKRINPLSLDILLASLPRIAKLTGPRAGDDLIFHPEMTSE